MKPTPAPTPEQRAALDRAKKHKTNPYRAYGGKPMDRHEIERIAPYSGRLVRR